MAHRQKPKRKKEDDLLFSATCIVWRRTLGNGFLGLTAEDQAGTSGLPAFDGVRSLLTPHIISAVDKARFYQQIPRGIRVRYRCTTCHKETYSDLELKALHSQPWQETQEQVGTSQGIIFTPEPAIQLCQPASSAPEANEAEVLHEAGAPGANEAEVLTESKAPEAVSHPDIEPEALPGSRALETTLRLRESSGDLPEPTVVLAHLPEDVERLNRRLKHVGKGKKSVAPPISDGQGPSASTNSTSLDGVLSTFIEGHIADLEAEKAGSLKVTASIGKEQESQEGQTPVVTAAPAEFSIRETPESAPPLQIDASPNTLAVAAEDPAQAAEDVEPDLVIHCDEELDQEDLVEIETPGLRDLNCNRCGPGHLFPSEELLDNHLVAAHNVAHNCPPYPDTPNPLRQVPRVRRDSLLLRQPTEQQIAGSQQIAATRQKADSTSHVSKETARAVLRAIEGHKTSKKGAKTKEGHSGEKKKQGVKKEVQFASQTELIDLTNSDDDFVREKEPEQEVVPPEKIKKERSSPRRKSRSVDKHLGKGKGQSRRRRPRTPSSSSSSSSSSSDSGSSGSEDDSSATSSSAHSPPRKKRRVSQSSGQKDTFTTERHWPNPGPLSQQDWVAERDSSTGIEFLPFDLPCDGPRGEVTSWQNPIVGRKRDKKVWICPIPYCRDKGHSFSSKENWNRHYRVVHMKLFEYMCRLCGQQFTSAAGVGQHLISAHNETARKNSYWCTISEATCNLHRHRLHDPPRDPADRSLRDKKGQFRGSRHKRPE